MSYKIRPGITHVNICGANLLIPTRAASVECPNVVRLGGLGSLLWGYVEGTLPRGLIVNLMTKTQKKPVAEIESQIDASLRDLCEKGFLIEVPDEEDEHDAG